MRVLVALFLWCLSSAAALAQYPYPNPIAPNQPCVDNSNRIANTHFVHACGGGGPMDLAQFYPGVPVNNAIIRIAVVRTGLCSIVPGTSGTSTAIAKTAATASTVVKINQITAGVSTQRGAVTFALSGTVGSFSLIASAMSLAAGDMVEFAYPASADATLADVAITLACSLT